MPKHGLASKMRRSVGSGIVVLLSLIVALVVIASSQQADESTVLLKLLPDGMPDISGIQTAPPTRAQIRAQMKKDGLSMDLFKQVPPRRVFGADSCVLLFCPRRVFLLLLLVVCPAV